MPRMDPDRRNGPYRRHLLITLGDMSCVYRGPPLHADDGAARLCQAHPRDRPRDPGRLRARASTRQVGEVLLPMQRRPVSAAA